MEKIVGPAVRALATRLGLDLSNPRLAQLFANALLPEGDSRKDDLAWIGDALLCLRVRRYFVRQPRIPRTMRMAHLCESTQSLCQLGVYWDVDLAIREVRPEEAGGLSERAVSETVEALFAILDDFGVESAMQEAVHFLVEVAGGKDPSALPSSIGNKYRLFALAQSMGHDRPTIKSWRNLESPPRMCVEVRFRGEVISNAIDADLQVAEERAAADAIPRLTERLRLLEGVIRIK